MPYRKHSAAPLQTPTGHCGMLECPEDMIQCLGGIIECLISATHISAWCVVCHPAKRQHATLRNTQKRLVLHMLSSNPKTFFEQACTDAVSGIETRQAVVTWLIYRMSYAVLVMGCCKPML